MSFTKTYFLCPTSEFIHPPPAGPLCLGSILRSTSTPQYPLNSTSLVPITNEARPILETDWKKTVSHETKGGLGVYAQFLQLVVPGLGPEIDVEHSSNTRSAFAFSELLTRSFDPTPEYVQEAVKVPAIRAWMKEPKQRFAPSSSLFLVTGIKLVKGANIKYSASGNTAVSGNIGINVAPIGMTFGPKGIWSRTKDDETEFNRDSEFVFAFRVKRLKMGRLSVKTEDYNKGAFLAVGDKEEDDMSILVEDVDGSAYATGKLVNDETEDDGGVYCVPA